MKSVMVGNSELPVSDAEYFLATLPPDTPIEWGGAVPVLSPFAKQEPSSGVGILRHTWFYDGVIAEVYVGHTKVTLWPSSYGDTFWVRKLEDLSRLDVPGTNGDGI